jgi:hypothetical protein
VPDQVPDWAALRFMAGQCLNRVINLLALLGEHGLQLPASGSYRGPRSLLDIMQQGGRSDIRSEDTTVSIILTPQVVLHVRICYDSGPPTARALNQATYLRYYGCLHLSGQPGALWGPPILTREFDELRTWLIQSLATFEYRDEVATAGEEELPAPEFYPRTRVINLRDDQEERHAGIDP